jgi:hypothetical protein
MKRTIYSVYLGLLPNLGNIHFDSAEWITPDSFCSVIRYSLDETRRLEPYGIRLDMDKRCFLDDLPGMDKETDECRAKCLQIWNVIVDARIHKTYGTREVDVG